MYHLYPRSLFSTTYLRATMPVFTIQQEEVNLPNLLFTRVVKIMWEGDLKWIFSNF